MSGLWIMNRALSYISTVEPARATMVAMLAVQPSTREVTLAGWLTRAL